MTTSRTGSSRKPLGIILALFAACAAFAFAAPAMAQTPAPTAAPITIPQLTLTPGEEVPPLTVNVLGYFNGTLRTNAFDYDLSGDGAVFTMAHIHMGAKGTNGPIVATLYTNAGQNAFHVTGTITPADLSGPLAGNWNGFLTALAQGQLYVNEHSVANPGGTARAQIPPTGTAPPATPTPAAPRSGSGSGGAGDSVPLPGVLGLGLVVVALAGAAWSVTRSSR